MVSVTSFYIDSDVCVYVSNTYTIVMSVCLPKRSRVTVFIEKEENQIYILHQSFSFLWDFFK